MNKLVLIFNEEHEVPKIPTIMIFNNELDAIAYLSDKGLEKIKIDTDLGWFGFLAAKSWSGSGKAVWAKHF